MLFTISLGNNQPSLKLFENESAFYISSYSLFFPFDPSYFPTGRCWIRPKRWAKRICCSSDSRWGACWLCIKIGASSCNKKRHKWLEIITKVIKQDNVWRFSEPDMAAVVRELLVNLHFLRRVKEKYHLVQSFSDSFPLWEELKLYKFVAVDWINANTYLLTAGSAVVWKKIILKTTNVMLS